MLIFMLASVTNRELFNFHIALFGFSFGVSLNAMEILINLTGANKLVGIISHREELMENIPQQIKVKKTKDGSRITIEKGL